MTSRADARPFSEGWIDVSVPIRAGMVHWPGDPPFEIERVHDMRRGDHANLSKVCTSAHVGTHMDAPGHCVPRGARIDAFPPDAGIGRARIIGIRHPRCVTAAELQRHGIRAGERLLFKTSNSSTAWKGRSFTTGFVYIAPDAAEFLASRRVRFVAIDYLSVDPYDSKDMPAHKSLLEAGIWVVEGVNLAGVAPGRYDLVCLPLRVVGGDGSPVRAVVRRLKA
jgi:arylformamidase